MTVHVVGIGLDGAAGLSSSARQVVEMAALLVGSDRHLSYFPQQSCERWAVADLTEAILEIRRWLVADANLEADADTFGQASTPSPQLIVILVAGDPLFHGWGKLLISQLPPDRLTFHPNLSSVQLAFNRLHIPWHDAHFVGSQGRFFEELTAKLKLGVEKIAVLADETRTPATIGSLVKALDLPTRYQFWVCENLGSAEEKVGCRSLEALLEEVFAPLSVVVLLRDFPPTAPLDLGKLPLLGIPDAAFIGCGDRPGLTVEREVRVLVLAQLALQPEQVVWDVGAGNGSVSIEIARLFPQSEVYAIEQTVSGTSAIELNCRRFELQNVFSIHGTAPEILHRLRPPHRILIGGSGGGLTKILGVCALRLLPGGSIVLPLDVFEDIATVLSWIGDRVRREPHWSYRIVQVQLSRSVSAGTLTRFDALNPISIVTIDRLLD
ncbi:precorrin-6y C5,15-methyltransferase (decarboxylating) subunit CbiE [Microcoleus sp. bin38.metabat.b11b12b14.051]|uniref:precorrin-6y C5,15-methyltransferase (decarboxylating) subunit CbiE n=1 Tax=Microcoleus sp. bin38.metabat.b11b12b14.051 TaxID=2742709 RepID=UPI0025FE820A|nr:precorrin-6y C5,15-methyltransferase (decarboxylating) subunit CbiE [Microcoleus sp. bin38.metabat.b11b12b14.051]